MPKYERSTSTLAKHLAQNLTEKLAELAEALGVDDLDPESGSIDALCAAQATLASWQSVEHLKPQLIEPIVARLSSSLEDCDNLLHAKSSNLESACKLDSSTSCRSVLKASFSRRQISCQTCGEQVGQSATSKSVLDWAKNCVAYPETICRLLPAGRDGRKLAPSAIAHWDKEGVLAPANPGLDQPITYSDLSLDSFAGRRKMYLLSEVARLWDSEGAQTRVIRTYIR